MAGSKTIRKDAPEGQRKWSDQDQKTTDLLAKIALISSLVWNAVSEYEYGWYNHDNQCGGVLICPPQWLDTIQWTLGIIFLLSFVMAWSAIETRKDIQENRPQKNFWTGQPNG